MPCLIFAFLETFSNRAPGLLAARSKCDRSTYLLAQIFFLNFLGTRKSSRTLLVLNVLRGNSSSELELELEFELEFELELEVDSDELEEELGEWALLPFLVFLLDFFVLSSPELESDEDGDLLVLFLWPLGGLIDLLLDTECLRFVLVDCPLPLALERLLEAFARMARCSCLLMGSCVVLCVDILSLSDCD